MSHHKRRRPLVQRASCWCKAGKKLGCRELRGGGEGYTQHHGAARARLKQRAKEA